MFPLGHRTTRADHDALSNLSGIPCIVREKFFCGYYVFFIFRMFHIAADRDRYGILGFRGYDGADERLLW